MINFFNDYTTDTGTDLPDPKGPLEETSLLEAAGSGFMKGAADIAGAAILATGGVVGLMEGGAFEPGAADKVFRFYDDYIKPARDYWTPDPESVSEAGRFIGGVTGFLPYVALGPAAGPAIIGSSTFGTAADLVESGVDASTATGIGVLSGAATGLMVGLPASGETFARTLAIAGANPILGAAQEGIQKKALEASGYEAQAAMFNPFDPVNRSLDLIMGGIFGGLSHYGTARKAMPVQFEDALDTAALAQKGAKNNPLDSSRGAVAHDAALNKAITDVTEGRPVDVAEVVKDAPVKAEIQVEPEAVNVHEAIAEEVRAVEEEIKALDGTPTSPEATSKLETIPEAGAAGKVAVHGTGESGGGVSEPKGKTVRVQNKAPKFNPDNDSLVTFVRKKGGIKVKDEGGNKAYMGQEFRDIERLDLLNNKVGMLPDAMRDAAESYGFGPFETVDDFYQALTKDVFDRNQRGVGSVFSKEKQNWDDVLDAELEAEVGRRLEDYPDTVLHMGTDETGAARIKPAVEVIDEARAEVQRIESMSDLYNMAADCLRRG